MKQEKYGYIYDREKCADVIKEAEFIICELAHNINKGKSGWQELYKGFLLYFSKACLNSGYVGRLPELIEQFKEKEAVLAAPLNETNMN